MEASIELSHGDICKGLSDCLNDLYPGKYCYVCDVFGDADSGDVVYFCDGQYQRAPYEIGMQNGKRTHSIDTEAAQNVLPRTVYDQEADDDDQYAGMAEAERSEKYVERFPNSVNWKTRPIAERFISKDERSGADASDFAGTGKSFPILKPGDVMAAVRSIGRGVAGGQSATSLKNKIKAIAKRKGWTKQLPKAWQDEDTTKESAEVELVGDVIHLKEGAVGQDGTAYLKLIAPGWGSSGYYSKELLKRDGPKIFKAGTKNFWNHQTEAEESARPEGDLRDLASTLTEDAHYEDPGTAGPGLYAKANVQPHFKEHVDSLAKHIGMSIRASGIAKPGTAEGRKGNIIEELTRGISVDYVTSPGAGGKILQLFEAARGARTNTGENEMEKSEIQALFKESLDAALAPIQAENKRLRETLELQAAPKLIAETLNDIRLPDASKRKILEKFTSPNVLAMLPMKEGKLDKPELDKLIESEAKREAAFLMELGYGSGIAAVGARMTEAELQNAGKDQEKQHAENFAESMEKITNIFVGPKLTKGSEDVREARETARKAFQEGRAA